MTASSASPSPTGAELAAAVRARAAEIGVPVQGFIAPLSSNPSTYLNQLAQAEKPKPHTVARIRALLAGEKVPPKRTYTVQSSAGRMPVHMADRTKIDPATLQHSDRHACPFCGVRSDVGCSHQPSACTASSAAAPRASELSPRLAATLQANARAYGCETGAALAEKLLVAVIEADLIGAILDPRFRRELAA